MKLNSQYETNPLYVQIVIEVQRIGRHTFIVRWCTENGQVLSVAEIDCPVGEQVTFKGMVIRAPIKVDFDGPVAK